MMCNSSLEREGIIGEGELKGAIYQSDRTMFLLPPVDLLATDTEIQQEASSLRPIPNSLSIWNPN